ncbi:MAG: carbamoyltransferase HypF [Nocardioidaceae bacterium]
MTSSLQRVLGRQTPTARVRRRFRVSGVVQGVGFRPFVYVTATSLALTGEVCNDSAGVLIEVEGTPEAVETFGSRLVDQPPVLALVDHVEFTDLPVVGGTGFSITSTRPGAAGRTLAGADVATCDDCLHELTDPADRRFRHPFISCTNCGPRFTVMTALPYDRGTTTMRDFEMCPACAAEYADPSDRRFHAQTVACHDCGPVLRLERKGRPGAAGEAALHEAWAMLAAGQILAVKGLGGYHLVCDAAQGHAVSELRRRKRRGDKPLAIMVRDLATARRLAEIGPDEEALLTGCQRPILLLQRRADPGLEVAEAVAPRKPHLGLMLPYTPLHTLLLEPLDESATPTCLVMPSGNLGGDPICSRADAARERLAPLVDGWLLNDRAIAVPCDDSVLRVVDGQELALRRSRGYAPLPVALPFSVPPSLAVGADLKNTCCVGEGGYAWLSQHVGDMDDLATLEAFGDTERHLEQLSGVRPERVACDAHPGYRSAGWAHRAAGGRPVTTVQHHHAHVAAVLGEHGYAGADRVIGVAFDGTGYGTDGAVWGGEVLLADYAGFHRFAHLAYVPLPGGDVTVDRPYRMALAHLRAAGVPWDDDLAPVAACRAGELAAIGHQLTTGFGCVPTSSMGRLFDAVASLAGVRQVADYEAEAAIELEGLSHALTPDQTGYAFKLRDAEGSADLVADAAPVVRSVVADIRSGVSAELIGSRFHAGVTTLVGDLACRARDSFGLDTVALGGGVFQNALLFSSTRRRLRAQGFTVLAPRRLPPNDAGIALGQLLVAASM